MMTGEHEYPIQVLIVFVFSIFVRFVPSLCSILSYYLFYHFTFVNFFSRISPCSAIWFCPSSGNFQVGGKWVSQRAFDKTNTWYTSYWRVLSDNFTRRTSIIYIFLLTLLFMCRNSKYHHCVATYKQSVLYAKGKFIYTIEVYTLQSWNIDSRTAHSMTLAIAHCIHIKCD